MALMVYTLVCSICNIVMITVQLIMMINKMLAHWKIARCARASQLYHRGPPLKLGDLEAPRARSIQTVRRNYQGTLVHNDTQDYFSKWNVSINSARCAAAAYNHLFRGLKNSFPFY